MNKQEQCVILGAQLHEEVERERMENEYTYKKCHCDDPDLLLPYERPIQYLANGKIKRR